MSTETYYIDCSEHGQQEETFVCQHIVQSLEDEQPRGFHWSSEDNTSRPDAWCHECSDQTKTIDGEWTEENMEFANVQLLCALCYDRAKEINFKQNTFNALLSTIRNAIIKYIDKH